MGRNSSAILQCKRRKRWGLIRTSGRSIHSSILAWKIPRTEEPGGLQSMGSQESDTTEPSTAGVEEEAAISTLSSTLTETTENSPVFSLPSFLFAVVLL